MSQRPYNDFELHQNVRPRQRGFANEREVPEIFESIDSLARQMPKPTVTSGLGPLNTLHNAHQNPNRRSGLDSHQRRSRRVPVMSSRPEDSALYFSWSKGIADEGGRSSKRQKMDSEASEQGSYEEEGASPETSQWRRITRLQSPSSQIGVVHERGVLDAHSFLSKAKSSIISKPDGYFKNSEFGRVNELIEPGKSRHKTRSREPETLFTNSSARRNASKNAGAIDLTEDEPDLPPRLRDEMAPLQSSHRDLGRDTSAYERPRADLSTCDAATDQQNITRRHQSSSLPIEDEIATVPASKQQPSPRNPQSLDGNIRNKFRRSFPGNSDIDELDGSPTVCVQPKKAVTNPIPRNISPQRQVGAKEVNDSFSSMDDVSSADIPPTHFLDSGPRKRVDMSLRAKIKNSKRKASHEWPIEMIWTLEHGEIEQPHLSLVHDSDTNDFYLTTERKPLLRGGVSFFPVKRNKVGKGSYAKEDRMLSLGGSREGHQDYIVDITFFTFQNMMEFLRLLNLILKGTVTFLGKPLKHMVGLFTRHGELRAEINEHSHKPKATVQNSSARPLVNQGRKRGELQNGAAHEQTSKRRRLVDKMEDEPKCDDDNRLDVRDSIQKSTRNPRATPEEEGIRYEDDDQLSVSESTQEVTRKPRVIFETSNRDSSVAIGGQERRSSLRNSTLQVAPGKYNTSDFADDITESDRHSVKVGLGPAWEQSVIYPETGAKRATVDFRDLQRLDEGEFLNDNLIAFYLRYCEEEFQNFSRPQKPKIYFFNNFFFTALSTTEKGQGRINYKAVERWTSKVDIFSFDYIVVPINEDLHWYVAIICNLPNLHKKVKSEDWEGRDKKEAGITVMNKLEQHLNTRQETDELKRQIPEKTKSDDSKSPGNVLDLAHGLGKLSTNGALPGSAANVPHSDDKAASAQLLQESGGPLAEKEDNVPSSELGARDEQQKSQQAGSSSEKKSRGRSARVRKLNSHEPAIIILDSLTAPRRSTMGILKEYLITEGDHRRSFDLETSDFRGINATKIPTQNNFCDCGLYLLSYVSEFLRDPSGFVEKVMHREPIAFSDIDPHVLRTIIRSLLQSLYEEQKQSRLDKKRYRNAQQAKIKSVDEEKSAKDRQQKGQGLQKGRTLSSSKPLDSSKPSDEVPETETKHNKTHTVLNITSPVAPKSLLPTIVAKPLDSSISPNRTPSPPQKSKYFSSSVPQSGGARTVKETKPSISLGTQDSSYQPSQSETQDDSVIFVSEQAAAKQAPPSQSREGNTQSQIAEKQDENRQIGRSNPRRREDEDSFYSLGSDVRAQLLQAAQSDGPTLGKKKAQKDHKRGHLEGKPRKKQVVERGSSPEEVDIVPESPTR